MNNPTEHAILTVLGNQHLLLKDIASKLDRLIEIEYSKLTAEQKNSIQRKDVQRLQQHSGVRKQ